VIRVIVALWALFAAQGWARDLPEGFVYLSDLAPTITQDIRYAGSNNFTAAPVPGYERATCILTRVTAQALIRAEALLRADGYGLVVLDCYRPSKASASFLAWAQDKAASDPGKFFFPGLSRADLFAKGYIAAHSSHSLGSTVDVSLRRLGASPARPTLTSKARCDEPGLFQPDMGTSFDCFSPLSATDAPVSAIARANRARLLAAMQAAGFAPYRAEWWHFRNPHDPARRAQDFDIH
jgi:zinc D-Ala-D-Ala dipeptidase